MLRCSALPASSSAPLRQSVRYLRIALIVNMIYTRTFYDHINVLHIFDETCIVLTSRFNSNAVPGSKGRPPLPSSALSRFLLPSFPPSSYLPLFLFPLLPLFFCPASLPPSFSYARPSILHFPPPCRRFGSTCKANCSYVTLI